MPSPSKHLRKLRAICKRFPESEETIKWGNPHFCVRKKIFVGCGEEKGIEAIGFKLEMDHAKSIIQMPGFWKAPYVGHKGWVSMDPNVFDDWDEIENLVRESYCLIAPKTLIKQLDEST